MWLTIAGLVVCSLLMVKVIRGNKYPVFDDGFVWNTALQTRFENKKGAKTKFEKGSQCTKGKE